MIPYINDNSFRIKVGEGKRRVQPSDEIKKIKRKLEAGMKVDDLSKEEYRKLNVFEKTESAEFHREVIENMSKAEAIAIKISKGEDLTEEEERFISEKYPDLKREAQEAKRDSKELARKLRSCKTKDERQMLISTATGNIGNMVQKGLISETQVKIKLVAIEEAIKGNDRDGNDKIGLSTSITNINLGTFLDKRI